MRFLAGGQEGEAGEVEEVGEAGEAGEGAARTSGHPEGAKGTSSTAFGELYEAFFFVIFQRVSSLCTSLRGVVLRRILEVKNLGSFPTENGRTTGNFRATATRSIEVSAESGPVRPKNSSDALFKAD